MRGTPSGNFPLLSAKGSWTAWEEIYLWVRGGVRGYVGEKVSGREGGGGVWVGGLGVCEGHGRLEKRCTYE